MLDREEKEDEEELDDEEVDASLPGREVEALLLCVVVCVVGLALAVDWTDVLPPTTDLESVLLVLLYRVEVKDETVDELQTHLAPGTDPQYLVACVGSQWQAQH